MPTVKDGTGPARRMDSPVGRRKPDVRKAVVRVLAAVCALFIAVPHFAVCRASDSRNLNDYDGRYLGDVDANGKLEPSDARMILRMSVGLEPLPVTENESDTPDWRVVDVNGDGAVSSSDARLVLRMAVSLGKR